MSTLLSRASRSVSSSARNSALLAALHCVVATTAQSPDLSCLKRPHQWPVQPVFDPALPAQYAPEGGEVLSDSVRISFRSAKQRFMTVFVERHQVVRFDDRATIERFGTISLPESFDPAHDRQDLPLVDRGTTPRPLYISPTVVEFAARVIGSAERARELACEGRVIAQKVRLGTRLHGAWNYSITPQGIMPGDTVEIHWTCRIPFAENMNHFLCWRYFFEGPLPKRVAHLRLEGEARGAVPSHWGIAPDSTALADGMARSWWTLHHLPGTLGEVNARPHDRPHLVMGPPVNSGWFTHRMASGQVVDVPPWVNVLRRREQKAFWWRRVAEKKVPDAQTNRMRDFIARYSDRDPFMQAAAVHNAIARDFTYQDDYLWYADKDLSLPKTGNQMRDGELREISRYDLYSKYLSLLKLKYYTAYVYDKRVGRITLDHLSPLWDNEWMFLLNDSGTAITFHPKKRRFGLFANELPFYWEGTQALVGDVDKLWRDEQMAPELGLKPELIPIATMRPELNQRGTDLVLMADLAAGTLALTGRVMLSGQYSTLCRSAWLYHEIDSTIDPIYARTLRDVPGITDVEVVAGEPETVAPYRITMEVNANMDQRLGAVNDSIRVIDLSGLVVHALPRDFHSAGRDYDFHFDFLGGDLSTYTITFDRPVQLLQQDCELPDTERQRFGSLVTHVRQLDATTIEVAEALMIKQERVAASDAAALESFLRACTREERTILLRLVR